MMDEGPVDGISVYEHAEEALLRYLEFALEHATTVKDVWRILNVELAINNLELSNKDELLQLCSEITKQSIWRDKIMSAIACPEDNNFFYANNVASRLEIDVTEQVFDAIKKDPIKNYSYVAKVYRTPEYAKELTALYEKVLPLDEMASGMGDYLFSPTHMQELSCLDFVLQELQNYPLLGEPLVIASLLSPVIRNRNGACKVINAWSILLSQPVAEFSPTLFDTLKSVCAKEVNPETEKRMSHLIAGDIINDA